jgi:hypothetical protein
LPFVALDSNIANVLGYLRSSSQLFGIDFTQRAAMISEDAGQTWLSVIPTRYTSSCPAGPSVCDNSQTVQWLWNANVPATSNSAWQGMNVLSFSLL